LQKEREYTNGQHVKEPRTPSESSSKRGIQVVYKRKLNTHAKAEAEAKARGMKQQARKREGDEKIRSKKAGPDNSR